MPITGLKSNAADNAQITRRVCLWALARLGITMETVSDGAMAVDLPADGAQVTADAERIRFTFDESVSADDSTVEFVTPGSRLASALVRRLIQQDVLRHRRVQGHPDNVHEIAGPLMKAYQVDGGGVTLAGCRLEDRAMLRLTYLSNAADADGSASAESIFLDSDGNELTADEVADIGLQATDTCFLPPRIKPQRLFRWIDFALRSADSQAAAVTNRAAASGSPPPADALSVDIVWCKYASGKLRFTIGDASCDATFGAWANRLTPPEIACPQTHAKTFHLSSTSDGRLAAAERIGTCSVTGRRMLDTELVRCAVTGQSMLPEFAGTCHLTAEPVLRDRLARCDVCHQPCHPDRIKSGKCEACENLKSIGAADPRYGRVLDEYSGLDRWHRGKMAESALYYTITSQRLLTRLLVVLDKQTLEVVYLATGSRLGSGWDEVPESQRGELLG